MYKLDTSGNETVLYNFTGGADGGLPQSGVIRDSAGNLYGTTSYGGTGSGVVYRVDSSGNETVLYSFTGGADGASPQAGVVGDSSGNLYGTTVNGGGPSSAGVVFQVKAATHQETVLHAFAGGTDGMSPHSGVIADAAGNLYGTTYYGGAANAGVVYQVDATGHETVLYTFTGGADGKYPNAGVIRDSAGNLYGTTVYGGNGNGVVYKVDTTGHQTVLHTFMGGSDGANPYAGVILDSAGNLYGTTSSGGGSFNGVVYKLDPTGHETVLHNFLGGSDGANPQAGVVRDSAGNLYGTTFSGGPAFAGTVYKVHANGLYNVLYSFKGGADGANPYAGVFGDSAGNLYGTTYFGGSGNVGVIYKLDAARQETVLHTFTGSDGANPYAGVTRDATGNLFGTTFFGGAANSGVVYKLDTSGQERLLYSFTGGADGANPPADLISDSAGKLYGTAYAGGAKRVGLVFKF